MDSEKTTSKPFRVERRDDGIAVLVLDASGSSVNTINPELMTELDKALTEIESSARGLVIASAKPDFLVGADLEYLQECETIEEGTAMSADAQHALDGIARLKIPTVAAVAGSCLGGGLELALACDAIVAASDRDTELGQPEIRLGLIPGAGGTQRLPRRIGLSDAVPMMLTGKSVPAARARRLGLVDELVARPIIVDVAVERAGELAAAVSESSRQGASDESPRDDWAGRLRKWLSPHQIEARLTQTAAGRKVVLERARRESRQRSRGNYPAPERLLDVIEIGLAQGFEAGLEAEREAFGELLCTPGSRELRRLFFLQRKYKRSTGVQSDVQPRRVDKVGVLGAGLMGSGITYVTAEHTGARVRLADQDDESVRRGMRHIRHLVDGRVHRGKRTALEADEIMYRIGPNTSRSGFSSCDLVIEAVFEKMDLKRELLRQVHDQTKGRAIFASNTSGLPIDEIAQATEHPGNVVGMHYFSPVEKMPLLEVVRGPRTSDEAVATAVAFGKRQGKTVIVVRDGPGFYTTRILAPLLAEAFTLVMEGVAIERVDEAVKDFGFPMGPIELADEIGLDVCHEIAGNLHRAFGDRMAPPPGLGRLLEDGRLGEKSGRGLYRHGGSEPAVDPSAYEVLGVRPNGSSLGNAEIGARCALRMINEAARCYGEGVLESAEDGDIGAILGVGFPPFLGGPFRYIESEGAERVATRLSALRDTEGARFSPAELLTTMAQGQGGAFSKGTAPRPGSVPPPARSEAAPAP